VGRRSGDPDAEPELRAWLLADRRAFRHEMCTILAESPSWSSTAWQQLSHSVDALAAGEPYQVSGWQLPDDHPMRARVRAEFVLGADDVLRLAE
jgi:hypothetical protein